MMFTALTSLDFFCMGLIGFSMIMGYSRGLVQELSTIANWLIAIWFSFVFHQSVGQNLPKSIQPEEVRLLLAFALVFVITLLLGRILNHFISWLVLKTGMKGPDRFMGLLFGFLRGTVFITLLILVVRVTPLSKSNTWRASSLIPYFEPLEYWLRNLLPYELE